MGNHLQELLQKGVGRLRGLKRTQKNNLILGTLALVFFTGLFFYHFSGTQAAPKKVAPAKDIKPEVLDPLNKIGKGYLKSLAKDPGGPKEGFDMAQARKVSQDKMLTLVGGYPMEKMVERLSEKSAKVSAFVVAIAKKESDWGKHVPTKNGRDCFNYWGYKGNYNLTDSGYSCFDNLEQAVDTVSDKIASLIEKKIDTPEKMVVWKCGSSCAGHDPAGVAKWISDVRNYKSKLN
jgi:hypothetical protein